MKFELSGYDIDNLLKKLYLKKITLYNVFKKDAKNLSFEVSEKDEAKVQKYIANFKTNKTPKFIKRLPKILLLNIGVILGVFFGCIFYIFASNYTWQITVYGTKELSQNDVVNVLNQNGIKKGKINLKTSKEIEEILLNNCDRIAQVSVIKQGTHIIINLSEKLVYKQEQFLPITAKFNGIVTKINIISGTNNVKLGEYVNIGDILVLPFNINSNGEKVSVKPMAEIEGKIFLTNSLSLKRTSQKLVATGKTTTTYNYKLFNFNLFSGKNKNSFALFSTTSYNENISNLVPFWREVVIYNEMQFVSVSYDLDKEKENLKQKSLEEAKSQIPSNCNIISENVTTKIMNDVLYANAIIELEGSLIG